MLLSSSVALGLQFTGGRSVGELSEHVEDFWKRRKKKKTCSTQFLYCYSIRKKIKTPAERGSLLPEKPTKIILILDAGDT